MEFIFELTKDNVANGPVHVTLNLVTRWPKLDGTHERNVHAKCTSEWLYDREKYET